MLKLLLPLVCAALLPMPAYAQAEDAASVQSSVYPAGPITLRMALDLALQRNPSIAVAAREVEVTDGLIRQAGILPNPELAALIEDHREQTRTTTVQLNQPLELGGKRGARVDAAERGRDLALAELRARRAEVQAAVTTAFYETLNAQERYRLAVESVDLAKRATLAASRRVMAGKISPVEETKAKIAESEVRVELAQAESQLALARSDLAASWGARQARFERVEGALDAIPALPEWESLLARLEHSPALQQARTEVERREALARLERSRQMGDITLSVGAKREEELGRNQAVLGFSIPLPLFDRNQGNLQEALSRTDKARDELAGASVRLENELAQSYQRLRSAQQEVFLFQGEILPGAQSAYDAAVKGFEYGKFSFLEVLDAQRTLFQAKSNHLRALSDAHRAAADIERIVGAGQEPQQEKQ